MTIRYSVNKVENGPKVTYTLGYEEFHGLGLVTFDLAEDTLTIHAPHGLSWFVTSFQQDDDHSARESMEMALWPLQDAGIAALVSFGIGSQIPARRYVLATEWAKLYPMDVAAVQYGALPGGILYALEIPDEGPIEALVSGKALVFRAVK